jgi:hypothetical protein
MVILAISLKCQRCRYVAKGVTARDLAERIRACRRLAPATIDPKTADQTVIRTFLSTQLPPPRTDAERGVPNVNQNWIG